MPRVVERNLQGPADFALAVIAARGHIRAPAEMLWQCGHSHPMYPFRFLKLRLLITCACLLLSLPPAWTQVQSPGEIRARTPAGLRVGSPNEATAELPTAPAATDPVIDPGAMTPLVPVDPPTPTLGDMPLVSPSVGPLSPLTLPSLRAPARPTPKPMTTVQEFGKRTKLRLRDYLKIVVEDNQTIQAQLLATEAGRRRAVAERGTFEPEFVGSIQHVENRRQNTVEQQRNLAGVPILDERNNLIDLGVESVTTTGAKVRLGYTLNNYNNNLRRLSDSAMDNTNQGRTDEWQSFLGLSLTQPLLRGGGQTAALATLRLAALNSDSAFQEYRRQLMVTLSQAESAYWGVYFAQEQLSFLDESVQVAASILDDSRQKVQAGKGTELDILEAEAGMALRRTKRNEASQKYSEAMGQLLVYSGQSPRDRRDFYLAVDDPMDDLPNPTYTESWRNALDLNPDYLIQQKKTEEARLRLKVAKNQALPELNLKGSAGLNGLGEGAGDSFDEVTSGSFPSWSVGLEMRVPLFGGIRGNNEVAAAEATVMQVQTQQIGMEKQIGNAVNTSIRKLLNTRATASDYRTMIRFNEDLLRTERDRLLLGKVEGRRVLEVEAGLFEVRQGLADALVQAQRAALELHLAEGSILKRRDMEFTPVELKDQTLSLLGKVKKRKEDAKKHAEAVRKVKFAPANLGLR